MMRTYRAKVDEEGNIRLLEPVELSEDCQVLVTVLNEEPAAVAGITLLSESALAEDWDRPEEREAWAYLAEEELALAEEGSAT